VIGAEGNSKRYFLVYPQRGYPLTPTALTTLVACADLRERLGSCPTIVPQALADTYLQQHPPAYTHTRDDNSPRPERPGQGLFRWWWQVMGSNHRRLSRRFYRPLPLATRATCRVR
jgi:hypothetical protein